MITIIDVLTPTILFTGFALLTIPILFLIRSRCRSPQYFTTLWVSIPFLLSIFSLFQLNTAYYSQPNAFLNVTIVNEYKPYATSFLVDSVSIYMTIVYLLLGLVSILFATSYVEFREKYSERYYALMLMIVGCLIAGTFSGDLLTLFIFWEAATTASYALMAFKKTPESLKASFKFLIMIVIASGFVIYGLSIVYGLTGSLSFWAVKDALLTATDKRLLVTAFTFIISGYAVEAAIVPFHMWLPDAYTAAPSSTAAFMSSLMDQASYYVLIRVLIYILTPPAIVNWPIALAIFSAITMITGNLFALAQDNVKRMLSYVCIADIGYNLIAITSVTPLGVEANLFFFLVGGASTALSFMCVGLLNRLGLASLDDFSGVGPRLLQVTLPLTIVALSFPGIPPLAGFLAKYMVFTAAIEANMWWLAIFGVLNSVIETAYFLRLIHTMFFKPQRKQVSSPIHSKSLIPIYFLVIMLIILGIYPSIILTLIHPVTLQIPTP